MMEIRLLKTLTNVIKKINEIKFSDGFMPKIETLIIKNAVCVVIELENKEQAEKIHSIMRELLNELKVKE